LSDTNPTFIGTVYGFPYLLIYLHYRSIKGEEIHEKMHIARQMAGWNSHSIKCIALVTYSGIFTQWIN